MPVHDETLASHPARTLLLPGWLNSDATHWQSRWEALHGCERVEQADWQWPRRGDWMARLDAVLLASATPAVLVAHSLGCQLVASWAAHSQHTARVCAALLVAPPDTERADMPPNLFNWRPIARQRLPFKSQVVSSTDDPYAARNVARKWRRIGAARPRPSVRVATSTARRAWATGPPAGRSCRP